MYILLVYRDRDVSSYYSYIEIDSNKMYILLVYRDRDRF